MQMSSTEFFHHGQRHEPRRRDGGEHEHDLGRPRFRTTRWARAIPSPACSAMEHTRDKPTCRTPRTVNCSPGLRVPAPKRTHAAGLQGAPALVCVRPPTSAPAAKISNGIWKRSPRFRSGERTGLSVDYSLTDDKAPVEVLGMHAIDQIIADEAGPYRILKTKASAVCCAPCSRFDTRTANVRAYGRLSDIFGLRNQQRGNPTEAFQGLGSRQTA